MPQFTGTLVIQKTIHFSVEAKDTNAAQAAVMHGNFTVTRPEEEIEHAFKMFETGPDATVDEKTYYERIAPCVERAERERLCLDFVVYSPYGKHVTYTPEEGFAYCKERIDQGDSYIRLEIEFYTDKFSSTSIDKASILFYGRYPVRD